MSVCTKALTNLVLLDVGCSCKLLNGWTTLMLLLKLVDLVVDLVERTYLIERQTNDTALLCDCLKDALTNPPYCV